MLGGDDGDDKARAPARARDRARVYARVPARARRIISIVSLILRMGIDKGSMEGCDGEAIGDDG